MNLNPTYHDLDKPKKTTGAFIVSFMATAAISVLLARCFAGCAPLAAYNSHVAAREDSLSGYSKEGNYGGQFSHRVEYR
jgi:hypothetical protein